MGTHRAIGITAIRNVSQISRMMLGCRSVLAGTCFMLLLSSARAQDVPYARTYQKSPEEVETALKELQAYSGQKLPIVDGFVAMGDKPLDRYERAFYQFSIELLTGSTGGTIVQVTAKITAWYADRDPAKSAYQVLPSSGRLELDLLDRLDGKLGAKPSSALARSPSNSTIMAPKTKIDLGDLSGRAPLPSANSLANANAPSPDEVAALRAKREAEEKHMKELSEELQSLREVQLHQAHPLNLVVVKKSGTPVLARPADGSRLLFEATANDEFEFIEANGNWIHVQISGLSRGYIRRDHVTLPELIAERLNSPNVLSGVEKSAPFRITREDTGVFPGDWAELKSKTVKIYTVQPTATDTNQTGARAKLVYARTLFEKSLEETSASDTPIAGFVVMFDSADGGILGTTIVSAKQLAAGTLSAEAFWKQCYMDPPEAFQPAGDR